MATKKISNPPAKSIGPSYEELKRRAKEEEEQKKNGVSSQSGQVGVHKKTSSSLGSLSYDALKQRAKQEQFEEDVKKVDSSYINMFIDATNRYYSSVEDEWNSVTWGNASDVYQSRLGATTDLDYRRNVIRQWLATNQGRLDGEAYSRISNVLNSYDTNVTDILRGFKSRADELHSKYKTQDEYDTAVREHGYWQEYQGMDYLKLRDEWAKLDPGTEKAEWLKSYMPSTLTGKDIDSAIAEVDKEIGSLSEFIDQWGNLDVWYNDYVASPSSATYDLTEQEVQERLSMYKAIMDRFGSFDGMRKTLDSKKEELWSLNNHKQYGLLVENEDFYDVAKAVSENTTAGVGIQWGDSFYGKGDAVYDYINDIDGYREKFRIASEGKDAYYKYSLMEPEEIARYNYLFHKEGEDSAYKYLDYLDPTLNARRQGEIKENYAAWTNEVGGWASIVSVPASLLSGIGLIDVAGQGISNWWKELNTGEYAGPVDFNRSTMTFGNISNTIREERAAYYNTLGTINLKEEDHPFWSKILNGKGWGDVYQLGMSMADSAASAGLAKIGMPGASALLGGAAGTQGVLDALNKGATDEQAIWMGVLNGTFEMLFESVSIDKLINGNPKSFISALLTQGGVEASEEGFTTIANFAADCIVMAEKSDLSRSIAEYLKAHPDWTEEQARTQALWDAAIQLGWDMVGGALSGGIMGGGSYAMEAGADFYGTTKQKYEDFKNTYSADPGALVGEALEINPDNKFAQRMQGKLDDGKSLSILQINHLVHQNEKALTAQDKAAIQSATEARLTELGETGDVSAIAAALTKQATGKKLSTTEQNTIANSKYGQRVANELDTEKIRSGEYTSAWAEGIGTERINAAEYSRLVEAAQMPQEAAETTEAQVVTQPTKTTQTQQTETVAAAEKPAATISNKETVPANDQQMAGKLTNEETAAPEVGNDYAVSVDGKAINTATNETVTLKGFVSSGGSIAIDTEGGSVSRENISYADEDQAVLYESILNLGIGDADYANSLLNAYVDETGDVSVGEYVNGMRDAFVYGQNNIPVGELMDNPVTAKLTPMQRNTAYHVGRQFAGKQTATAEAIARQNRIKARVAQEQKQESTKEDAARKKEKADTRKASAKKGGVYYGYDGKTIDQRTGTKLSKMQEVGVDFAKRLAASRGMTIYFYESYIKDGKRVYKDANGKIVEADNGFYDPKTGAIHIDLNAGEYGHGTVLFTIAHELTHFVRGTAPAQYKKLCSLLMKGYKAKGQSVSELVAAQQAKAEGRGEVLSFDEAYDEVIADSMESILADGRVMELMSDIEAADKGLLATVKKFFRNITKLIKQTVDAYKGVKPDSAEGRMVQQMEDIYGQLQEVFAKGVYEGGERIVGAESDAIEAEVKHSLRVFSDGKRFVDVQTDQSLFDGLSVSEMNSLAKKIIRQRFANKVIGIENKVFVNGASAHEYVFPSKAIASDIREAKLRAAPELDNLLDAGTNFRNAPDGADGHYHPSAIGGFDYFDTIFKVGNEYYSGVVNIQVIQRGKLLKDITKIRNITKDIISSYGANPKSDFLRDASMDSIRNPDEVVKENDTTATDKIKRSGRNAQSFTEAEAKAIQGIGRKSIHQFNSSDIKATEKLAERYWKEMGNKSPFFRAWFGDWRFNDQSQVQTADIRGDTRGRQKNEDTGWNIQVSGQVFNETKIHNSVGVKEARPYLPYINDIVKKAILLDTWGFNQKDIKSENSLLMHSLYAVADIGNGPVILKLYVEEMNDPSRADTSKRAYQLQNIEKAFNASVRVQGKTPSSLTNTKNAIRTVADLFSAVKQQDMNFAPKAPSAVVNIDGMPKVVFHGTSAVFDTFSYGHIGYSTGVGILGDGFYFTDKKNLAKNYGREIYPVYLKMNNPYMASQSDAYKLNTAQLEAQGYDGVILEAPAGNVYMVFNSTQIKSATDNIGTFDGMNPNVKRSARSQQNATVGDVLKQENEQLKADVEQLREMLKLQRTVTNGTKFTKTSVEAAARLLMRNANAKGNVKELTVLLNGLYERIAGSKELTWESVKEAAQPAVDYLQDHVQISKQRSEYADDILRDLRTSRVYLDDTQVAEVEHRYGSYNNFRKAAMGSIIFAKDRSISLDSKWQELAELYPDVFDVDMNAADMPEALMGIISSLRDSDTSALEYEYNRDMIAQDLLRQVYDSYWRVSTLKTFADVKQKEINTLKNRHAERMMKLREESQAKIAQMKADHRAALERQRQKHTEAMDAQRKKITEQHKESRKRAVEGREKTAVRHKIQRVVAELNGLLLTDDKKRHVPDSLKKAVAEALSLVNMDTVGAEERIARYEALIANETDQDKIDAYTVTMENIKRQGEKMGQRLKELHSAYEEIAKSTDPDIANAYDPVISGSLAELSQSIGNTALKDMSLAQLEDVYDMYRMVLTRVRDANKSLVDAVQQTITDRAGSIVREIAKSGGVNKLRVSGIDPVREFSWNNLKPVYAMERLGSQTLTEAFGHVRAGEDIWARDVTEAKEFYSDQARKYGYDGWDMEKTYRFESTSGTEFDLTLEQIMSLYAYSKRDQALDHLRLGGFVFDSSIEVKKERIGKDGKRRKSILKYKVNTADAHQLSAEILGEIVDTLSDEQRSFVDAMQEYLSSTMGAKGNQVTMKMYGVKLFKEKFYFPLKSARQFLFEQNEVAGEVRIKNSGFTNKAVPKANNPVILNNFMDVWASHVNDMGMYHAFTLPLEDFNRLFNYNSPKQEGSPSVSVKGTIQNAYSPAAVSYIKQLITDLNGGAVADPRETPAKAMLARFKKAKVFASLSVVIQQPSAIGRAFALVHPKYFRPTKDGMSHTQLWNELKKYSPVAIIKEMGYFDTNMGKSTLDFIKAKEYSSFTEKAKAVFTDSGYRDEVLSKAPALADEITWCAIWNAVKRETMARNHDLSPRSEEFLSIAGNRFTEVVTKTQVYDSVLARSANMRSKSGLMSMATSFMAEPTTTINMLEDAVLKAKRGHKKYAAKVFASVAVSIVLNNALVSLVYAMRDDDEEETYAEKYAQAFVSGLLDDINPVTYYPYLKDMWSLLQGFDVERSDMSLVEDLTDAAKKLVKEATSEDGDLAGAWWDLAGAVANIGGIPIQNICRDTVGAINFVRTLIADHSGRKTTVESMSNALAAAVRDSLPVVGWLPGESKSEKICDALTKGDTVYVERLRFGYSDEKAWHTAVRKAMRDGYEDGRIDEETAVYHLIKDAGMAGGDAVKKVNYWVFQLSYPENDMLTEGDVEKYYEYGEPVNIDLEEYESYCAEVNSGMKKDEVLAVIDSLELSTEQKDALYFASGYAESRIGEAPWH